MIRFTTPARFGFAPALALAAFASAALTLTPPAFASTQPALTDDGVPQATLNVAGVDFTSAKAVAHVKNQVRRTARAICAPDSDGTPLTTDQRKCIDTALHTGFAQVDSKNMAALRRTSTDVAAAQPEERPAH